MTKRRLAVGGLLVGAALLSSSCSLPNISRAPQVAETTPGLRPATVNQSALLAAFDALAKDPGQARQCYAYYGSLLQQSREAAPGRSNWRDRRYAVMAQTWGEAAALAYLQAQKSPAPKGSPLAHLSNAEREGFAAQSRADKGAITQAAAGQPLSSLALSTRCAAAWRAKLPAESKGVLAAQIGAQAGF